MKPPRWRCADASCSKHRWQPVTAVGEYDPVDVALEALEAHHQREHSDAKDHKEANEPKEIAA